MKELLLVFLRNSSFGKCANLDRGRSNYTKSLSENNAQMVILNAHSIVTTLNLLSRVFKKILHKRRGEKVHANLANDSY